MLPPPDGGQMPIASVVRGSGKKKDFRLKNLMGKEKATEICC
jgi:hypothetical protein